MSAPSRCHQPSALLPAPSALIGGKNWRKCATRLKKDRKYGEGCGKERLEMVKSWLGGRTWDRGAVVLTSVIFFQIARSREDIVQGSTLTPIAKEACGLWRCLILWYDRLCMWHQGRLRRAFIKEIYGECCRWDDARPLVCSAVDHQDKDKDYKRDTKWDNVWLKAKSKKKTSLSGRWCFAYHHQGKDTDKIRMIVQGWSTRLDKQLTCIMARIFSDDFENWPLQCPCILCRRLWKVNSKFIETAMRNIL